MKTKTDHAETGLDPARLRRDALLTLRLIAWGKLDPRGTQAARAQLHEANRILHQTEKRAWYPRHAIAVQRKEAWGRLFRAIQEVTESRRNDRPPLTHQERVELIFRTYAPIAPPESLPAPPPPALAPPNPHSVDELRELVCAEQQALEDERRQIGPRSSTGPSAEEDILEVTAPGQPAEVIDANITSMPSCPPSTAVGEWRRVAIPGFHPPRFKRIWVPACPDPEEGHEQETAH
jgi:hypothetical protein